MASAQYLDVLPTTIRGDLMGRIGRCYPRFEEAPQIPSEAEGPDTLASQTLGAIIGVLCALGLIGWLLTR